MGKLINADALMARLRKSAENNPRTIASALCELVCGDIELEPEAVVRCKDCKNSNYWHNGKGACYLWAGDRGVYSDGYCDYGERRTDETD